MQPDIICLGEALVEFNLQPDGRFLQGHGGDTSNVAIAAARQGARAGYLTRIGADAFGDSLTALWNAEGVDVTAVTRDEAAPTGIYFVTHGPDGHRFSYDRAGSAASRMTPGWLPCGYIRAARVLHVSGISLGISESAARTVMEAIELARGAGVLVSCDPNLREQLWPPERAAAVTHEAMAKADIALPGLADARRMTGLEDPDTIMDYYLGLGPTTVALTLGAGGVLVATPDRRAHIPGVAVEAMDATGAGDTFDGAFLARLMEGCDPFEAAVHANAAAALSTLGYGAVAPMPHRAEVEAFLPAPGNETARGSA